MINFEENKVNPREINPRLDKSKQKELETQEISAADKKGENKNYEKDEPGIIPIISKVETGEWKSREQIIQDIKEYFDAFVKYILKDGWKKEAIRAMFLYPEGDTFAWMQKDGGYTKNFDCPLYKEYKNHHRRATVNDFDSLIFRLWGLHPEDEQENPI